MGYIKMTCVLVVEDDFLIRLASVEIVETAGFVAIEAADADEAIALLEARSDIGLVFTDVEMPGTMDGLKLARYIRERWPPIILLVASGRAIVSEADLPEGTPFVSKPFQSHQIADKIKSLMNAARS